mmetsp:Transcript_35671/g.63062  ORF Transcript_35671/g.63062 Transcript_35671/m.63062 type:complete len:81 (+) Transcript_35671:86-328(+)
MSAGMFGGAIGGKLQMTHEFPGEGGTLLAYGLKAEAPPSLYQAPFALGDGYISKKDKMALTKDAPAMILSAPAPPPALGQ